MDTVLTLLGAVNLLLDLAGLLLWLGWRSTRAARTAGVASPYQSVLRPAQPVRSNGFLLLLGLGLLLLARAWAYWRIGSELKWVPAVDLGVVRLPFNSIQPGRMLLFSLTSFGAFWTLFYLWLLLLSVVNQSVLDTDPLQRWVRRQLGWVDRWPSLLKVGVPPAALVGAWVLVHPQLIALGLAAPPQSTAHVWQQGIVFGAGAFLAWKYLIVAVLFLHVANSYLYLGNSPLWISLNGTAQNLMRPLRWLPLRLGRIDLAPLVGMAATLLAFNFLERGLTHLFARLPL